ncbi:MAG: TatD family hydrolase [Bacilli bacterium]
MKLIDTHCHLNADVYEGHHQRVIEEANQVGVQTMFVVGWDERSSFKAIQLARSYPNIKAIVGLHPVDCVKQPELNWLKNMARINKEHIVAIGEIGLDYYWQKSSEERQTQAQSMVEQIQIANELKMPITIHCRDAYQETLSILKAYPVNQGGVMHCYGGPASMVREFIALGFALSFGGPVTFKNAHEARASVLATPLDKLLIETDAPYLSPHPFRGQENKPSNLTIIFETIAKIKNISTENLESVLLNNTKNTFHVKTL